MAKKRNNKKMFKNKVQMIIYLILSVVILGLFVIIGTHDFDKDVNSEGEQFNKIYNNVPKENDFTFSNVTDVNNIINGKNQNGVILFGFPANKWTKYYAEYISDVAHEFKIDKILYYDFFSDRNEGNGTYETIVNSLNAYVPFDDVNKANIFAPSLVVVKNGEVIAFLDETAIRKGEIDPEVYWNHYQIESFKDTLREVFKDYVSQVKNEK